MQSLQLANRVSHTREGCTCLHYLRKRSWTVCSTR